MPNLKVVSRSQTPPLLIPDINRGGVSDINRGGVSDINRGGVWLHETNLKGVQKITIHVAFLNNHYISF